MKALGIITWFCVAAVISALLQAWTITKIWTWFVAIDYGPGPSMGAWFGITTVLSFIVSMAVPSSKSDPDESLDSLIKKTIIAAISKWIGCLLLLAIVWLTGSVLGWTH